MFRRISIVVTVLLCLSVVPLSGGQESQQPADPYELYKLFPKDVDFYWGVPDIQKAYPEIRKLMVNGLAEKGNMSAEAVAKAEKRWGQIENMVLGLLPAASNEIGVDLRKAMEEIEGVHFFMIDGTFKYPEPPKCALVVTVKREEYLRTLVEKDVAKYYAETEEYHGHKIHKIADRDARPNEKPVGCVTIIGEYGIVATSSAIKDIIDRATGIEKTSSFAENPSIVKPLRDSHGAALSFSTANWQSIWKKFKKNLGWIRKELEMADATLNISDIIGASMTNAIGANGGASKMTIDLSDEMEFYKIVKQKGSEKKELLSIVPSSAFAAAILSIDNPRKTLEKFDAWAKEISGIMGVGRPDWKESFKNEMGFSIGDFSAKVGNEVGYFWILPDEGFKAMNRGPTGIVLAFPFDSPESAEKMLTSFRGEKGEAETYSGITLYTTSKEVSTCVVGKYWLVSLGIDEKVDPSALKKTIDTIQGKSPSVAQDDKYKKLLAKLPAKNAGVVLIDWQRLAEPLEGEIPFAFTQYLPEWREAMAIVENDDCMEIQTASDRPSLVGLLLPIFPMAISGGGGMSVSVRRDTVEVEPPVEKKDATPAPSFSSDEEREKRIKELIVLLDDDDWQTRQDAIKELTTIGEPAVPLLSRTYEETKSAEVKSNARTILVGLGRYDVSPELVKIGVDKIATYLGYVDWGYDEDEHEIEVVVRPTREDGDQVVVPDFAVLKSPAGIKALWKEIESRDDVRFKRNGLALLSKYDIKPVAQEMFHFMEESKDSEVQRYVATVLLKGGDEDNRKKTLKVLIGRLSDENKDIRYRTYLLLDRFIDTERYNPYHGEKRRLREIKAISAGIK